MVQCGRDVTPHELDQIRETVALFRRLSRTELAKTICEHLEWYTASGGYKTDACMNLLEKLEDQGAIKLPEKDKNLTKKRVWKPIDLTDRTNPGPLLTGTLEDVAPVELEVVTEEEMDLWKEYVSRYHYLKYQKPFGCPMYYFVKSRKGVLGCVLFSGAARAMRFRDDWIGWKPGHRLRNLGWITNNTRFLILPWVRIRFLASHVLGRIRRRIGKDFQDRWGYTPVLMETFVDPKRYSGISYKAANWDYIGMTTGEGLPRKGKVYSSTPKMIFVQPVVKDFRERLCSDNLVRAETEWG